MEFLFTEENVDQMVLEVAGIHASENLASIETQDRTPSISEETVPPSEQVFVSVEMEMTSDRSNASLEGGAEKIADIQPSEKENEHGSGSASDTELHDQTNQLSTIKAEQETPPQGILKLDLENEGVKEVQEIQEKPTENSTESSSAAGKTSPLVASSKKVKCVNSDNNSPNERETEAEFLRLSLGFKCDLFTMEKRLRLEERSRDLVEENLKKELSNSLKLLETLVPVCEEDNQSMEIVKKLEKSLQLLNHHTERVGSRAEMLGAIHQESRVSKAVDVMIQHVENLKRMYAKEHAELEELKLVLLQNEKSVGSPGAQDELLNRKLTGSINQQTNRRFSIAAFPQNGRNPVTGLALPKFQEITRLEKNETFPRRTHSGRSVGSKTNENRPSLQRLISTCPWGGLEENPMKEYEQGPPEEEVKLKKPLMEGNKPNPLAGSKFSSWVSHFRTSFSKANLMLWIFVIIVVFVAALVSFFAGLSFQRTVDAAPVGTGDAWTSLQQLLWPYTGFQHNGQPPV